MIGAAETRHRLRVGGGVPAGDGRGSSWPIPGVIATSDRRLTTRAGTRSHRDGSARFIVARPITHPDPSGDPDGLATGGLPGASPW